MSVFPKEKIKEIHRHLETIKILGLINYHVDKIQDEGAKVRCFCPIHKEIVFRTLIVDKEKKEYRCSYNLCSGNKGGDLIDLFAKSRDISYEEALMQLVEELQLPVELPPTDEFIAKELEIGENLITMGQFDEAYEQFLKVIKFQPDNIPALKGMVEVASQAREDEAAQWLEKLVLRLRDEQNYEDLVTYAEQLLARNETPEIRGLLAEAYETQGFLEQAYNEYLVLADIYEAGQQYDKALTLYRKIQKSDIDILDVNALIVQLLMAIGQSAEAAEELYQQAKSKRERGKLGEAEDLVLQALELDQTRSDIRREFVEIICEEGAPSEKIDVCAKMLNQIIEAGELDEAAAAVEQLLAVQPENPSFLETKLRILRRLERHEEANRIQLQLSDLYLDSEMYDLALTVLVELLDFDPKSIEALGRKAAIHRLNDEIEDAVNSYTTVISILKDEKNLDQALGIYEILREIKPDDMAIREEHIQMLASAGRQEEAFKQASKISDDYVALGDLEQAINWMRFALEQRDDLVEFHIKLAELLVKNHQMDEAEAQYFKIYEWLHARKEMKECVDMLQRILALNPGSEKASVLLATSYIDLGDTAKGVQQLRELAVVYRQRKDYDNLEHTLLKILQYQAGDPDALQHLADMHIERDNWPEAEKRLLELADVHANASKMPEALKAIDKILQRAPQNIFAHQKKIELLDKQKRTSDAIQARFTLAQIFHDMAEVEGERDQYLEILERDPEREAARKQLIQLNIAQSERDDALTQLDELTKLYRSHEYLDAAEEFIEELLKADAEWLDLRDRLVSILKESGKTGKLVQTITDTVVILERKSLLEGAVDQFSLLIEIEPDVPAHRIRLIETLMKLGWQSKAMDEYRRLAEVYINARQHQDALQVYAEIKKHEPHNLDLFKSTIDIHLSLNDHASAIEEIFELAAMQRDDGKTDDAIATLRGALEFEPANIRVHQQIIDVLEKAGRIDEALKSYRQIFDIHIENGNFAAAITTQKAAIAHRPNLPELHRALIKAYESDNKIAEALDGKFTLATLLHEHNEIEEAIGTLNEILAQNDKSIKARRLKANIYKKSGRNMEAMEELSAIAALLDDESFMTQARPQKVIISSPILDDYNFDTFVVGGRNTFAFATAMAIAKEPAKHYNPLFLYSDVGLGKTHLLHAIANYFRKHSPDASYLYLNAEEFTSSLIEAIQNNSMLDFRARYRDIDCLMIDDIQFLAGKERAQEEFFHIFNTLFQAQKQIVITSDRPPKEIKLLEKRLKSRFGAGVIVEIQAPDFETRIAILKREVEQHHNGITIPYDCVELMAEKIESNIRQLKGALNQLIATQRFTGQTINADFTRQVLDSITQKI